jgi:thiamine-phosphate pyrophosphorylase
VSSGDGVAERCQLYLITPPAIDLAPFADRLAAALDAGPIGCVQLRLPGADAAIIARAAEKLAPVAHSRDVAFLLNGPAALAKETGCDGVHLDDAHAVLAARQALGDGANIGASCGNNGQLALDAADDGADYVSFGPFFPSRTVPGESRAELETLAWWARVMTVPAVAIGGINAENCAPLVAAGTDFLAVIAAVWDFPTGPAAGVTALREAIAKASSAA